MKRVLMIFFAACITAVSVYAQTSGTLSVTVTTSTSGGNYSPRNVVAIWIEDSSGKYIKTLLAYAANRRTHLNNWESSTTSAGSAFNVTDAISGATQSNYGTYSCTWNGTDYLGKPVADGTYSLKMELTDKNATGNSVSYSFKKGTENQKISPSSVPSFSNVSIEWKTQSTNTSSLEPKSNTIIVYPNPGTGLFRILGENIKSVQVTDLSGKTILKTKLPEVDLSSQIKGEYLIVVKTKKETFVRKVIKG